MFQNYCIPLDIPVWKSVAKIVSKTENLNFITVYIIIKVGGIFQGWFYQHSPKPPCAPHGFTGTHRKCPALRMASPEISETALHSAWLHRSFPKPSCTAHGSTGTLRNRPALCMASSFLSENALRSAWLHLSYRKTPCVPHGTIR